MPSRMARRRLTPSALVVAAAADGGPPPPSATARRRLPPRSPPPPSALHRGERDREAAHAEAVAPLQPCCTASELQPRLEAQRRLSPARCAPLPPPALRAAARRAGRRASRRMAGAAAACVALNSICCIRWSRRGSGDGAPAAAEAATAVTDGGATAAEVQEVVGELLSVLPKIDAEMPRNGALRWCALWRARRCRRWWVPSPNLCRCLGGGGGDATAR